jgi:hypothetical protein
LNIRADQAQVGTFHDRYDVITLGCRRAIAMRSNLAVRLILEHYCDQPAPVRIIAAFGGLASISAVFLASAAGS